MEKDLLLRGLHVNGQPFFARSRTLTLSATGCRYVLKLAWLVHEGSTHNHFIWLLSRLERCATVEPPWQWDSHHPDSSMVHFRAWLVSPVGYGGDMRGSLYTTFRLHVYLAPDDPAEDTPPAFCPVGCNHVAPPLARDTFLTPQTVTETVRQARRQLFATMLQRWMQDESK